MGSLVGSLVAVMLMSKKSVKISRTGEQLLDVIDASFEIDLDSVSQSPRAERFIGHAIDASIIVKKEWEDWDFNDTKLKEAMKLLSPGYIRFGGILSDHTRFVRERPENFR